MKVFNDSDKALYSMSNKDKVFLNSWCPFNSDKLCGNWCALFYISPDSDQSRHVILGCKGTDKRLYVE